ncbi:hypothetical protein MSG28_007768 [Choristoneura fumiferana]|uniref:Uncharacterized protein n=1 Tax=Choristoneura fumiferana TaxID=7141 RepID=A0ACC0JYC8_CHOFU|nr:hypothetical protein MSG28_007768 [Choristoneura fumiferana]
MSHPHNAPPVNFHSQLKYHKQDLIFTSTFRPLYSGHDHEYTGVKTCKSCGCDRLQHSVYHEELGSVRERLGLRDTRSQIGYDGYDSPPGLTAKQTELYWSSLAEREPNAAGASGAAAWRAWRARALASQLPKQDLSLAHCRHVGEQHRKSFEDFVAARNEIALDIGVAGQHHGSPIECLGCDKPIRSGSVTVRAPRLGEEAFFHPACFTCAECDELLVELAYCALDGRLFCVRHYAERLKPRCHACDEHKTREERDGECDGERQSVRQYGH